MLSYLYKHILHLISKVIGYPSNSNYKKIIQICRISYHKKKVILVSSYPFSSTEENVILTHKDFAMIGLLHEFIKFMLSQISTILTTQNISRFSPTSANFTRHSSAMLSLLPKGYLFLIVLNGIPLIGSRIKSPRNKKNVV